MNPKNYRLGLDQWSYERLIEYCPSIEGCNSLSEASRLIFNIKTLTSLITDFDEEPVLKLKAFFGSDHSSLVDWNNERVNRWSYFHALPEHKPVYKKMLKDLGLAVTVRLTHDRDFGDIATGYLFLKADKRRYKRFQKDIIEALPLFPKPAHSRMIHDYIDQQMRNEERKNKPIASLVPDLPIAPIRVTTIDGYKILVPHSTRDLKRIGTAQSHCVGTHGMGYAGKIKSGLVWIVAIYEKSLADGICVELSQDGRQVFQAQGKHRRSTDLKEMLVITKIQGLLRA